nr:MAG TPA: hypothetical protein [Bacteriophage sp.]
MPLPAKRIFVIRFCFVKTSFKVINHLFLLNIYNCILFYNKSKVNKCYLNITYPNKQTVITLAAPLPENSGFPPHQLSLCELAERNPFTCTALLLTA